MLNISAEKVVMFKNTYRYKNKLNLSETYTFMYFRLDSPQDKLKWIFNVFDK